MHKLTATTRKKEEARERKNGSWKTTLGNMPRGFVASKRESKYSKTCRSLFWTKLHPTKTRCLIGRVTGLDV